MGDWAPRGAGATTNRVVHCSYWAANVSLVRPSAESVMAAQVPLGEFRERVIEVLGDELYGELVDALKFDREFRRDCWLEQRRRFWSIRNHQIVGGRTLADAIWNTMALDFMVQDSGIDPDAWNRSVACSSSGCVCMGCDLWDGQRLASC